MRQIFSVRFFAAIGALVGLVFLLSSAVATSNAIDADPPEAEQVGVFHKIDLVEQLFSSRNPRFRFDRDGLAAADTELIIDGRRSIFVVAGTPGENLCPKFGQIGACAVVADLLGEAVVWFALVPMGPGRTVRLPAIDVLDNGVATLVNGWQLPFAPVLDRRCGNDSSDSYRAFRNTYGDNFVSIFDIEERRLVAVRCRTRVEYAPPPASTATTSTTTSTTVAAIGS